MATHAIVYTSSTSARRSPSPTRETPTRELRASPEKPETHSPEQLRTLLSRTNLFAAAVDQAKAEEKAEASGRLQRAAADLSRVRIQAVNLVTKRERDAAKEAVARAVEAARAEAKEQYEKEMATAVKEAVASCKAACKLEMMAAVAQAIDDTRSEVMRVAAAEKAAALRKASVVAEMSERKAVTVALNEADERSARRRREAVKAALDIAWKEAAEAQAIAVAAAVKTAEERAADELATAVATVVLTTLVEATAQRAAAVEEAVAEANAKAVKVKKAAVDDAIERTSQEWARNQHKVVERVSRAAVAESMKFARSDALQAAEEHVAATLSRVRKQVAVPRARQRLDSALTGGQKAEGEAGTSTAGAPQSQPAYVVATALKQHESTLKALVTAENVPMRAAKTTMAGPTWSYIDTNTVYGNRPARRPPSGGGTTRQRPLGGGRRAQPQTAGGELRRAESTPALAAVLRGQTFVNVLLPV